METVFIPLSSGAEICAPSSVSSMTNYVLREQGDWFEDEIHFVRRLIEPGMNALDIGANFGVYSSAIAKSLGGVGRLWCFEPTPDTAQALRQTLEKNGFDDFATLVQKGLSNRSGVATFYVGDSPELNSLSPTQDCDREVDIELSTLDACAEDYGWPNIDFIKLDAEGAEVSILEGGREFFSNQSPVVMFELMHAGELNFELISAFRKMGFDLFRLVPALGLLAPFDEAKPIDGFWLNLFAVKVESQQRLCDRGLLVRELNFDLKPTALTGLPDRLFSAVYPPNAKSRLEGLVQSAPYYSAALSAYLASRDESAGSQERCDNLHYAFAVVTDVLARSEGEQNVGRLLTFARICLDIGQRDLGSNILSHIIENYIKTSSQVALNEPFVLPGAVFETIDPMSQWSAWLWSSVIDCYVRKSALSSCFGGAQEAVQAINVMTRMGFVQPDMLKRRDLIIERAKLSAGNAV